MACIKKGGILVGVIVHKLHRSFSGHTHFCTMNTKVDDFVENAARAVEMSVTSDS